MTDEELLKLHGFFIDELIPGKFVRWHNSATRMCLDFEMEKKLGWCVYRRHDDPTEVPDVLRKANAVRLLERYRLFGTAKAALKAAAIKWPDAFIADKIAA